MKWSKRRTGLAWAVLACGAMIFAAAETLAVSIPNDVYTLPVGTGDATTVDLGQAAPFEGTPQWVRLRPNDPPDSLEDFTATVDGSAVLSGSGTPGDAWVFDITFEVTWNGTIDELQPTQAIGSQMLFAIVDSRFGPGMSFDTTSDLFSSGFVRGSMAVNGVSVMPEIVLDDTGAMTGDPEGFVRDFAGSPCACNRWLGFYLVAEPEYTQTITLQWALGQRPVGSGDVFFPNALFLPVPEPGTATLIGVALLAVAGGASRRRIRR